MTSLAQAANNSPQLSRKVIAGAALQIVRSANNEGRPFVVIDKIGARAALFDRKGKNLRSEPILLGLARGDIVPQTKGDRVISELPEHSRVTPAGRFPAAIGSDPHGDKVVWFDYDDAVALHIVITSNPGEQRLKRIKSPYPVDRRISYGCVNVTADFFKAVASQFAHKGGLVYVLAEV